MIQGLRMFLVQLKHFLIQTTVLEDFRSGPLGLQFRLTQSTLHKRNRLKLLRAQSKGFTNLLVHLLAHPTPDEIIVGLLVQTPLTEFSMHRESRLIRFHQGGDFRV